MSQVTHDTEKLRQFFKKINRLMLILWRLGFGPYFGMWPKGWGRIMILQHTGRKSGTKYHTPVNFTIFNGDVYCVASLGTSADWYQNVIAHPEVEIWLPDGWWRGTAEDASEHPELLSILRRVMVDSGFATPFFEGFNPKTISDEALSQRAQGYCLVRIRRTEARTGPHGPGDLAWIWPILTFLLLPLALRKRSHRRLGG